MSRTPGNGSHRVELRFWCALVLTGVAAGVGGIALTELLHLVQHVAFGYTETTFLAGVQQAPGARRVLALTGCGVVAGLGWWALRRFARPVDSVPAAIGDPARSVARPAALGDAVLQIVAVGGGASLGREGAPRLVGGAAGEWLAGRLGLPTEHRAVLLACGAGAGLSAVYDVPLGGTLFTVEILLVSAAPRRVLAALISSLLAALVAATVLGDRPTYRLATELTGPAAPGVGLIAFALVLGPAAGLVGLGFDKITARAARIAPSGWRLPVVMVAAFAALGVSAIAYPELLGNGRGPAQLAFDGSISPGLLAVLLLLKPLATAGCLAAGARGGLLTPALATGALLGALAGGLWTQSWSGQTWGAAGGFAVLGAAAVLAVTQRAPLCAVMLTVELTGVGVASLAPLAIAVAGACVTARVVTAWAGRSPAS